MKYRWLFSILGTLFAVGLFFNWILWRMAVTDWAVWITWFKYELSQSPVAYGIFGIGMVGALGALGFFLGQWTDEIRHESERVSDRNFTLDELATTDPLTKLFNMRYIHERLDEEMENAYRSPLSCLLVDIDHFKDINDTYGHPVGDHVLVDIGRILKKSVRRIDCVGRMGGEEFIIIMPDTPQANGLEVGQRIREEVSQTLFSNGDAKLSVKVSVGVVTYPSEGIRNKANLLSAVDQALYTAKRTGRNRVVAWQGTA